MKIKTFIFARGGSKGIKNKNIKLLNGKPLLFYSIDMAKKFCKKENIFVSTDSNKIALIAKKYGVQVIKRPKLLSKDNDISSLRIEYSENPKETVSKLTADYDLLILGTPQKDTFKSMLFGTGKDKFAEHSACSVLRLTIKS